nr:4564_t:CDS:2 [Entrophospora candida]
MIKPDRSPFCPHSGNIRSASGTIYIGERLFNEKTYKSKVVMYPSKKKENIMTKAGQYIFLRCPGISLFEWHRLFYLTSALEDYISVYTLVNSAYKWIFQQVNSELKKVSLGEDLFKFEGSMLK